MSWIPQCADEFLFALNEGRNLFDHKYHVLPAKRYAEMFGYMINQQAIEVRLEIGITDLSFSVIVLICRLLLMVGGHVAIV